MADPIDTNSLLLQLRSLAQQSGMPPAGADAAGGPGSIGPTAPGGVRAPAETMAPTADVDGRTDFGALVGDSLRSVNARAQEASRLTSAYEGGHPDVELADVMVAVQKARVSFEALSQVRNKMVAAYRDVMNTPL